MRLISVSALSISKTAVVMATAILFHFRYHDDMLRTEDWANADLVFKGALIR